MSEYPKRLKSTKANCVAACLRVLGNATAPHCAYMLRNKLRQRGYGELQASAEDITKWMAQLTESGIVRRELHWTCPSEAEWRYSLPEDCAL